MRIYYSPKYLGHSCNPYHPENPKRVERIINYLKSKGISDYIEPKEESREILELVHDPNYVNFVEEFSREGGEALDPDTYLCRDSFSIALLSASGVRQAALSGEDCFVVNRPPGHHATKDKGMGFCIFNNVAIASESLINQGKARKVMILDWDAHHGNGTQEIFYSREDVLYVSIHQDGRTLYPGTGFPEEVGAEGGEGYTVNIPLPPGAGDETYSYCFEEIVLPIADQFSPDHLLVSCGFDCHEEDYISSLRVTERGFRYFASKLREMAPKITIALEGGYNLNLIGKLSYSVISGYSSDKEIEIPHKKTEELERIKEVLSAYWSL